MKSTAQQRLQIHKLTGYNKDFKAALVEQITGDPKKISTLDLTPTQAASLIKTLCTNWAAFEVNNKQHMYVLSLLRQAGWVVEHPTRGTVPDLSRLSNWLKSIKSPVKKPLNSMSPEELSTIINALEQIVAWEHKKK